MDKRPARPSVDQARHVRAKVDEDDADVEVVDRASEGRGIALDEEVAAKPVLSIDLQARIASGITAACAIDSTSSTPGVTGLPGKCPR